MIRYSGGNIVEATYTSDGSKSQIIGQITAALTAAGWTAWGGGIYESALTPQGFKIRVDVIDGGGPTVHIRLRSESLVNTGYEDGGMIRPVSGRVFRIWANKYQLFHFQSGIANITDPSDVAFGVLWCFFTPPEDQPIFDQDLIAFTETSTEDCMQRVYHTWNFGPWGGDTVVRLNGTVDDDIRVNGVIWDEGLFPFNSGRGVPCDGIANGIHDFDKTFDLPADTPIMVELINNFISTAMMNAHITVVSPSHAARAKFGARDSVGWGAGVSSLSDPPPDPANSDPWYGWMACNGNSDINLGHNNQTWVNLCRGVFNNLGYNGMWIWDGVAYSDFGGTSTNIVGQVSTRSPNYSNEVSGRWENGIVSIYEPYVDWPSGHTTSGGWANNVRKGQLWDAMVYAAQDINNEATKVIDGKVWRNITVPNVPLSGNIIPHSLLLLTS